ncbi:MAG: hypothetical protein CV087_23085 [Candidatus Brocadia sp. WS118]|nr:MAG: hypothetical protein CV087_23085 [Candidatus Brocadia sp. WS118]
MLAFQYRYDEFLLIEVVIPLGFAQGYLPILLLWDVVFCIQKQVLQNFISSNQYKAFFKSSFYNIFIAWVFAAFWYPYDIKTSISKVFYCKTRFVVNPLFLITNQCVLFHHSIFKV